jgi:hypothetical protein
MFGISGGFENMLNLTVLAAQVLSSRLGRACKKKKNY